MGESYRIQKRIQRLNDDIAEAKLARIQIGFMFPDTKASQHTRVPSHEEKNGPENCPVPLV
jgi:hypothetical protein